MVREGPAMHTVLKFWIEMSEVNGLGSEEKRHWLVDVNIKALT